ncbi:fimbria/pilus outer membrane usher protein [Cysteiniphilum marinum]|uniref:fimbria/pilus outer membrane usher protein n=1 Tax=Cysteiniphilum marinum TaxID=2774191 RepID=UPI001939D655|nr:fimbria/pilus outer membrane usher protein [Cysteiniphilum marinum]
MKIGFNGKLLCLLSICALLHFSYVNGATKNQLKINTSFFKDFSSTDAQFLGDLSVGQYFLDLLVNGKYIGSYYIVSSLSKNKTVQIKLPLEFINQIHAKPKFLKLLKKLNYTITKDSLPYVSYHYDQFKQNLNLTVADGYLYDSEASAYADPKQWEFGISGGDITYGISLASQKTHDIKNYSFFNSTIAKYNWGKWQFYSQFNNGFSKSIGNGFNKSQNTHNISYLYANTILPKLKSEFILGYNQLPSQIFGGLSFYGATLQNDINMLPTYQHTFKPEITGVANGPITLELYQRGQLIYKKKLNPGPYAIHDYNTIGAESITQVITDDNGVKTSTSIPYQIVSNALYPGVYHYTMSLGSIKDHQKLTPIFAESELDYGLNNYFTPYGGIFLNQDYLSQSLGTTVNLGNIGGISLQEIHATFKSALNNHTYNGFSSHITYYKSFNEIGSSLNIVGYIYESKQYISLQNAIQETTDSLQHTKNQLELSVKQSLFNRFNLDISTTFSNNWDGSSQATGSLLLTGSIGQNFNWSLNYNQSKIISGIDSGLINKSLSLTFSWRLNDQHMLSNTTTYDNSQVTFNPSYSYSSETGKFSGNIGASISKEKGQSANNEQNKSLNAGVSFNTNVTFINFNGSLRNEDEYSLDGSLSGTVVYTQPTGFIFTQSLGKTFAIVNTQKVSGVHVDYNNYTNAEGYGIYDGLQPYEHNRIQLHEGKHQNGRLKRYQANGSPVEGAILYRTFKSQLGNSLFIDVSQYPNVDHIYDQNEHLSAEFVYKSLYYLPIAKKGDTIDLYDEHNKLLDEVKLQPFKADQQITLVRESKRT